MTSSQDATLKYVSLSMYKYIHTCGHTCAQYVQYGVAGLDGLATTATVYYDNNVTCLLVTILNTYGSTCPANDPRTGQQVTWRAIDLHTQPLCSSVGQPIAFFSSAAANCESDPQIRADCATPYK